MGEVLSGIGTERKSGKNRALQDERLQSIPSEAGRSIDHPRRHKKLER